MSRLPRASLSRVLEDLDPLVELVCGDAADGDITGIVIHDPVGEPTWDGLALVLGVGVHDEDRIADLLAGLTPESCAGLVLRSPPPDTAKIAASAGSTIPVLRLAGGVSWMQLTAMLNAMLTRRDVADAGGEMLGGIPAGELFSLANAVADLLDAPVTIEDRSSRVLAFSGRQDEADPSRIGTILNRQVSAARTRDLKERGVFDELYRSSDPLFVEPPADGLEGFTMPRVALTVRAGEEILGFVWAAVHEPLSPERARTFRDIGNLVALHMLSQRAGAHVERRLRADLVATALAGGAGAAHASERLGFAQLPTIVIALALDDTQTPPDLSPADRLALHHRVGDALSMHLTAARPGSATAVVGDAVYGIIPLGDRISGAERRATRLATEFLDRTKAHAVIGVGTVATSVSSLSRSRDGADRALRVLRGSRAGRRVACVSDVSLDTLLIDLADVMNARGGAIEGPLATLTQYDAKHHTFLVQTLDAWLGAFGDVNAASRAVHVHPNTFRYRLGRLAEVGEIDLGDHDTRLALMVQLRLLSGG